MLAVRNTIPSIRRKDLESNAELLACELRPESKMKVLVVVFYRPPNSDLAYIKEFKKSLIINVATSTFPTLTGLPGQQLVTTQFMAISQKQLKIFFCGNL